MTNNIIGEWIEFFWKFGITIGVIGSLLLMILGPILTVAVIVWLFKRKKR